MCRDCGSKCTKCRKYCRLGTTFLFSHVGLCALVVGYSLMGAFTFEALEASHELAKRETMLKERSNLVSGLWSITTTSDVLSEKNWSSLATEILQNFEVTVVRAVKKDGYDGKDESPLQWTFSGALLYSIIVITTIGYGNVAPKTSWGKVITIFYAIVGIPLLLLCLSNIGDAMAHSFKFIYWKMCCYFCVRPKKRMKKSSNRSVCISYCAPTIYPADMSNLSAQSTGSRDADSPDLTSSGTYFTAHSTSSPTISSCKSTPSHQCSPRQTLATQNERLPKTISAAQANAHIYDTCSARIQNTAFSPVIMNKYALQEDVNTNGCASKKHKDTMPSFPALNSVYYKKFVCRNHKNLSTREKIFWKEELQNNGHENQDDSLNDLSMNMEDEEVSVPVWLCFALVISYICGGAVLFTFWEKWNFLDSSYFCFVTLTTIGFGDLVPGTAVLSDDNQLTLGLCSLYLLFGMALLAMSFNLVQEEITQSVRCIGRRIGIISDDEDD